MPFLSECFSVVCVGVVMMLLARDRSMGVGGLMQKSRKTALSEGDILIGALFSIHQQPKQKTASTLTCGQIREQYGIQRVEAAFLAIDQINQREDLLPNITLGVEIRDSCWYSSIALEQSIEFIRDALASPESTNSTLNDTCSRAAPTSKHLVGVVGPGSSDVTIQVQNLLQLFSIPQVGYSATSRDLSDKSRFSYLMRVVPSDYYQAQVMVDFVRHFNWTYVSAVHTDGNYGQSGMTAFRELAEQSNICIAKEDSVLSNAEDDAFDKVIHQLLEDQRANVVVCFCEGMTVRHLLKAAQRNNVTSRFLFLGSDGWADRSDVVRGLEETAVGGLSIKIHSQSISEFDDHYFSLQPDTNLRNPWFIEFWQMRFNCSIPGLEELSGFPRCSGNESLRNGYKQDTKMGFVMKAIYTMAWGLHDMQQDLCKNTTGLCSSMLPINGSLYRDYLMNVTYTYMNETVTFDSRGDPPGRYDIMNYQRLENGSFEYVPVGSWDNGTLVVFEDKVVFNSPDKLPPTSVCSEPCSYNEYKSFVETGDDTQKCCWLCIACLEDQFLKNETACQKCQPGYWPFPNKTGCEPIPVKHIMWDDEESIAALCLTSLGMFVTLFTMIVFIKHNHTPVVKASTRELSYIIFVGMMVSYCATLPLLARPSPFSCALARVLPGLSFAMIYAALVTKTNRIARILAGTKKIMTRKPRFMSATAQVVITCILISIELGIITTMLILDRPDVKHIYPAAGEVKLVCNTTPRGIMAPMGWDFFLIAMCTVYAIKTRNLPENFNEAKFIGFSMYTTCVIWMAWVPIYFGSDHKIICMSVCTSLSALVILVLLFFPKIYIILLRPDKNDRSAFKTTTDVRCHIGSTSKASISRTSDRSPSAAIESMYVGSAMLGIAQPQLSLMQRIRSTLGMPFMAPPGLLPRDPIPRNLLKREISVWSDASGSGNTTNQTREMMLRRAYGSQLDLAGIEGGWSREERSCQTTDDLLDPLIPRLRRRVARAVREKELEIDQGREFFTLTHSWMSSQADAARNAMNRKDSQKSTDGDERPTTTIIREDIKEEKEEERDSDEKKSDVKEEKKDEKNGDTNHSLKDEKEKDPVKKDEKLSTVVENTAAVIRNGSVGDVAQNTSECKVYIHKAPCEEEAIVRNHCSAATCNDFHGTTESSTVLVNNNVETSIGSSFQKENGPDNQVVNFIGYGSVMACDPAWKKQRSVSCDNGVIYNLNNVTSVDHAIAKEKLQRSHGWIPNEDCGNIVSGRDNGHHDNYCRKRKVGVAAKVSDIRGILKSGSLSAVDKDNRVSFDSELPERRKSSEEKILSPVSSEDSTEMNCQSIIQNIGYQNVSFTNPDWTHHSESEKAKSRILEEALSAESDVDMSDNCELKTIIIRLGSDDAKDSKLGPTGSERNGNSINWRPKLGRNHKILSHATQNYSFDNPVIIDDVEIASNSTQASCVPVTEQSSSLNSFEQRQISPNKNYARENELVILDILQNSFSQRYPAPTSDLHYNSQLPHSSHTPQHAQGVEALDDLSPTSLKSFTISPPENYRNSPTATTIPAQMTDDPSPSLPICSLSVPYHKSRHISDKETNHISKSNVLPDKSSEIEHSLQTSPNCCSKDAADFAEAQEVCSPNDRLNLCSQTSSHLSSEAVCCTLPAASQHPQFMSVQGCDKKEDCKSAGIRRIKTETDDDTDESTTPLEEFFRTRGIKFDVTSTKSKKL